MTARNFSAVVLCVLMAAPAFASLKEDLDAAAKVAPGDHSAWTRVRDRLVAQGKESLKELEAAAAADNWTAAGWTRALAAEVARLRIARPELAQQVDNPKGINPEFYRITRLGKPFCRRDFGHMGAEAVPLMLERFRYTLDAKTFSEGEFGLLEREALATALLQVPGQTGDTRARFAMLEVLRNPELPANWRQDAAVSYGQTGGKAALNELGAIIDDARQPLALREGAAWALGRVAEKASVEAIKTRLNDARITAGENGPALVRALVNGAGILGSSWGWKARGESARAKAEEVRQGCARLLVDTMRKHPAEAEGITTALVTVVWRESPAWLNELARDEEAGETARLAARKAAKAVQEALANEK